MTSNHPDQAEELRQLFRQEQKQKERGIDILELPARKQVHKRAPMRLRLNRYLLRFFAVSFTVLFILIYFII